MKDFSLYLAYMVMALVVPMVLASRPVAKGFRSRFVIAVVAAIVGGIFVLLLSKNVAFSGTLPGQLALRDMLTAFLFAAACGTFLYSLGKFFFGGSSELRRT